MNSKDALLLLDADVRNLENNYLKSYDRELLTVERFVYLVKSLFKEGADV